MIIPKAFNPRRRSIVPEGLGPREAGSKVLPFDSIRSHFKGGILTLTIVQGEKLYGSGKVFGKGKYSACAVVKCGDVELGRSNIERGMLSFANRKWSWLGFESSFKPMMVSPSFTPVIKVVIYDCDRDEESLPLGEVQIGLQHIKTNEEYICELPIERINNFGVPAAQGILKARVRFAPFDSKPLKENSQIAIDSIVSKNISFGVGWDTDVPNSSYAFGASLVIFDSSGAYIEDIDSERKQSDKGIPVEFKRVSRDDGFLSDKEEICFDVSNSVAQNITAYFLVLTATDVAYTLQQIKNVYCRVFDYTTKVECCRYEVEFMEPATSCVLARIHWDTTTKKWCVSAYRALSYGARSVGFLIPNMKDMLSDIIPGCRGSPTDRLISLSRGDSVALRDMYESFTGEVTYAVNWYSDEGRGVDLDTGCILVSAEGDILDCVSFEKLKSDCGNVIHSGDSKQEGTEEIQLFLEKLGSGVCYLAFYVICYEEKPLSSVEKCVVELRDSATDRVLIYDKRGTRSCGKSACLMSVIFRYNSQWYYLNSSNEATGRTVQDNTTHLKQYIATAKLLEAQAATSSSVALNSSTSTASAEIESESCNECNVTSSSVCKVIVESVVGGNEQNLDLTDDEIEAPEEYEIRTAEAL
mmetsp:Transcript_311/g.564  ORF Transcript_311/g.564 Transcript_311/m.564 type:complete len:641 (+) Transcript_311:236-2158(+)|eukprot:CAMPEP_0185028020 /NCGR_PEP_ID=MMETSP1103-20130426/13424_1 /TAXON_ID=36769 /ORGANISM="Paraphysomonas bandaiensis, Strain Caron Lab Isolate" /LENGTH=640 /DNA_ID=CAMNT_0027562249 /DNA_START=159 /DNA_END=2081 /DNA_ORIENTATION=-